MVGAVGKLSHHLETSLEKGDCFEIGRARDRTFAGSLPIGHGLIGQAGFGEVLGEEFRLPLDYLGKVALEHHSDPRMKFLAAAAQQARISRVAHEGMFEEVGCGGRCAAAEDEAGIAQAAERHRKVVVAATRNRRQ